MEYYSKLEKTDTTRIYNIGKENGFCIITAFEKPYKSEIPYKVKLMMEAYKDQNEFMYEKLVKSGYMFLPVYGIYKGTYDAISYFVINKKKESATKIATPWDDITSETTYRIYKSEINYTPDKKDKIIIKNSGAKPQKAELPLPQDFTTLMEQFYASLESSYSEEEKEPDTFQYYLQTHDTINGKHCQQLNTGLLLHSDELPKKT